MTTYEVITGREGRWWWIEIPAVDGGFSQAKRLTQVEAMAREVIALLLNVADDSFGVTVRVEGAEAEWARSVAELDAAADKAREEAAERRREAAKALKARGLPVRDIAELLHVSQGWVSQLTKPAAAW